MSERASHKSDTLATTEIGKSVQDQPAVSRWLSETILLALASALILYAAKKYECGLLGYYALDCNLATISTDQILETVGPLSVSLFFVFHTISDFWSDFGEERKAKAWSLAPAAIAFVLFTTTAHFWSDIESSWVTLVVATLIVLGFYGPPLFFYRKEGSHYSQRLDVYLEKLRQSYGDRLFALAWRKYGPAPIVLALTAIFFIPSIAEKAGRNHAWQRESYPVTTDGTMALIRVYGDRGILAEVSVATPTLTGRFSVINMGSGTTFETRTTGHLQPGPQPN